MNITEKLKRYIIKQYFVYKSIEGTEEYGN
jgi:hypothetical protein